MWFYTSKHIVYTSTVRKGKEKHYRESLCNVQPFSMKMKGMTVRVKCYITKSSLRHLHGGLCPLSYVHQITPLRKSSVPHSFWLISSSTIRSYNRVSQWSWTSMTFSSSCLTVFLNQRWTLFDRPGRWGWNLLSDRHSRENPTPHSNRSRLEIFSHIEIQNHFATVTDLIYGL